ncbi:PepSY-associated TM helix domain-containing protein [Olivibacter ginsenosidimutans]|uniref:PepSY-associated TM helix domain-containing protein n=1 Tax=Olivibacter ginsenosidimutans TaxID=1176537 RepID=A0ABP9AD45_9SPHI
MQIIKTIHLWLGIASGLVVFLVSITGALLVFEEDITLWGHKYAFIPQEEKAFMTPTALLQKAESSAPKGMKVASIWYGTKVRSARISFRANQGSAHADVYLNPYNAEVLNVDVEEDDHHEENFFHFMEDGHVRLWLPESIGKPLVGYGTLAFIVTLITGLIWWYPAKWNRGTVKKSFLIKWKARFKRLTIDLHNVPGFYSFLIAILLAITGLYFSFPWVGKASYWMFSGGKEQVQVQFPTSDTSSTAILDRSELLDRIWKAQGGGMNRNWKQLFISFPIGPTATWVVAANKYSVSSHATDLHFYDQYSGRELHKQDKTTGEILKSDLSYRILLYNYNIHLGRIGGVFTKWLAFVICLICASLPVTGVLIWYNRKWKRLG